jgi:hypothetical protein
LCFFSVSLFPQLPLSSSAPSSISSAYFYGHTSPEKFSEVYQKLIEKLATAVNTKFSENSAGLCQCQRVRSSPLHVFHPLSFSSLPLLFSSSCCVNTAKYSGCIINTCGMVEGLGYSLILHAALSFKADVILVCSRSFFLSPPFLTLLSLLLCCVQVLGDDRLFSDLKNDNRLSVCFTCVCCCCFVSQLIFFFFSFFVSFPICQKIAVAKLTASGGVVQRQTKVRQSARNKAIRTVRVGFSLLSLCLLFYSSHHSPSPFSSCFFVVFLRNEV